ncbi:MAG: two-component system sensor histidine kinase HydH [Motiliproteus sp.]|jgi:two-component system sensor histidine kinase HydH
METAGGAFCRGGSIFAFSIFTTDGTLQQYGSDPAAIRQRSINYASEVFYQRLVILTIDQSSVRRLGPLETETTANALLPRQGRVSNRLATKYLWLSLLVALVPLVGFASLYDAYFSQLVSRLTEEQLATRMAATQNEFRVFIRERKFELEALADQFDNADLFTPGGRQSIAPELESLLRLQVDAQSVYGVVFYDHQGRIAWTFPETQLTRPFSAIRSYDFEGAQLVGPSSYSIERPAGVLLRQRLRPPPLGRELREEPGKEPGKELIEQRGSIGLVLRFNSLTEIFRGLDQSSTFRVFLQAGDGNTYDILGQPVTITGAPTQQVALLPGWSLHVIQNPSLVMSSVERMRYWLILLMACTVAGLLWLHMSISRRLNRQVESLIHSVEKVALGDLDTPVTDVQGAEMQRLTQAIERMRQQLKTFIRATLRIERQATLGQLAAGLAHDIRNPLTTIRTTIVALSRRESDPENREMMAVIEEEIDRVNEVLEQLLNFARPREPHGKRVSAEHLLSSISTLVGTSARNQGIQLCIQCPDPLQLWVDEGHLRQVMMNLILNALQAMSVKGQTISLHARRHQDEIALSVTDDGQGMSAEIQTQILEPFFTTKLAGTGLGLATCAALVKSNAGRMHIESTEGKGTAVTLFLPRCYEAEAEAEAEAGPEQQNQDL